MSWLICGNTQPYGDEPVKPCEEEDGVKCYCCGGYFPESSCVANTLDEGGSVPVCEACAEGRVRHGINGSRDARIRRQHGKDNHNG